MSRKLEAIPLLLIAGILLCIGLLISIPHLINPPPIVQTITMPELEQPAVIMEVLDPSLNEYAPFWQQEIGRRFPHAVGVLVHGGDFVENEWIVGTNVAVHRRVTPIDQIVRHEQALHPDRTIVLLACNTGHLRLGIPGVYYARSSVWCVPDRFLTAEMFTNGHALAKLDVTDPPDEPTTRPTTQPTALLPEPVIVFEPAPTTRWQTDPEVVGNIFEFVKD